ncbi:MAG: dockerin type I repeat-containing protein [Clostridia bacterium]
MKNFKKILGASAMVLCAPFVLAGCAKEDNPPISSTVYGDVNQDCKVDNADITCMLNYIKGEQQLNEQQLLNADVNGDEEINFVDKMILNEYVLNYDNETQTSTITLPYQSTIKYGDVNLNGEVKLNDAITLSGYLADSVANYLTFEQQLNADVNQDGLVNQDDRTALMQIIANE